MWVQQQGTLANRAEDVRPQVKLMHGTAKTGGKIFIDEPDDGRSTKRIAGKPQPGCPKCKTGNSPVTRRRQKGGKSNSRRGLPKPRRTSPSCTACRRCAKTRCKAVHRSPFQWRSRATCDGAMRESINRVIRDVRYKKGNVLILVMNCGGTDLDAAKGLAHDLAKLQTGDDVDADYRVHSERALNAAAIVAMGCSGNRDDQAETRDRKRHERSDLRQLRPLPQNRKESGSGQRAA